MEIRQLKYFISAAHYLNFTKAAKECCIVQTAMTQQIQNLECEIGTKLFERNHRNMKLTPAGEIFLEEAKTVLARAERAVSQAQSCAAGYDSTLRIGYHGELVKKDLAVILKQYRAKYPEIKVLLYQQKQEELIAGLGNEETDFIFSLFSTYYETLPWMHTCFLGQERLKLAVSKDHPLAGQESVSLEEIKEEPFIFFDEKSMEEREMDLAKAGVILKRYGGIYDHTSGELLVECGYGVSIWAERLCSGKPDLCFLDIRDHPETPELCLSWKEEPNEVMQNFLDLVKKHFQVKD